ncbi:MAG: hypothetical protein ABEJ86_07880 [Halococcoides sp.]
MLWIVLSDLNVHLTRSTVAIAIVAGLVVGIPTESIARFGARKLAPWTFWRSAIATLGAIFSVLGGMISTLFIPRLIVVALIIGAYAFIAGGVLASVGRGFVWPRVARE